MSTLAPQLAQSLAELVGHEHVLSDAAARQLAASDLFIWPEQQPALAVVRPRDAAELARVMALLHEARVPVVPRGAGMSYTGGVVPQARAVIVDIARINAIEVHAEDLYAVVGAGCTWEKFAAALKPHRLRAAQINPISGSVSTIGGAASQGVPGGMDGILGLTVVLADGTVAQTGSGALHANARGQRLAGPDLTGLFLGDCGAFGVKAEVVLRLTPERPAAFASFAFDDAQTMLVAMIRILREGLATRVFSMDQAKSKDATAIGIGDAIDITSAVARRAGSLAQMLKDVTQLAIGPRELGRASWSLHCVTEGLTEALAQMHLALARDVCREGGTEIDNVLPKTLRAKPYSIRGFVGPEGERWVPVHGIVPMSRARECMAALQEHFTTHAESLAAMGIAHSWMISSVGTYVTIEPMLYWRDALDPIHLAHLSERNRARFGSFAVNPAARERVIQLRAELRNIMDRHDAVHAQIGRFYRYDALMDNGSRALVERIKLALDPNFTMNPGALIQDSPRKTA